LDEVNSISITYAIEWDGCTGEMDWFWDKFVAETLSDGLQRLPVATRQGHSWLSVLRKESNSLRVVLHEKGEDGVLTVTPEAPEIPPYLLYRLKARIKMRCESTVFAEKYLSALYGGSVTITEKLFTKEWAMIAALNGAEILIHHKLVRDPTVPVQPEV
jgi:hypothetical protein